jgi:hypothetical protein
LLAPAIATVWTVPGFVTQDGPAHVYNAQILLESFRLDSPYASAYTVRWRPVPNWAGHLSLMGMMTVLPPRAADRLMMTATLAGLAAAIVWLRRRVAGTAGLVPATLCAAMLALNVTWLFGFSSFLLGACLFCVTLGIWASFEHGWGQMLAVGGLLVAGYFCHPISLGWTVVGMFVLATCAPGPRRRHRIGRTMVCLVPLVPLVCVYRTMIHGEGAIAPVWEVLDDPLSIRSWMRQLAWVDPLTLGRKLTLPFGDRPSRWFVLCTPIVWFSLGMLVSLWPAAVRTGNPSTRGWWFLGLVMLVAGVAGPDTIGARHGNYLAQRTCLLGLIALVPACAWGRRTTYVASTAFLAALTVQSALVVDYAVRSDGVVREFLAAQPYIGKNSRIGTLLVNPRGVFRANPLWHVDSLLGIGTGNIVWSNYESAFYYFPVRVRDDVPHPDPLAFEEVWKLDSPADHRRQLELWEGLLARHHAEIEVLVVWGNDARLNAFNERWYRPVFRQDRMQVFRRRGL